MGIGKLSAFNRGTEQISTLRRAESVLSRLVADDIAEYSPVVVTAVLLPEPPSRWRSFGASSIVLFLFVSIAVAIPILFPDQFEPVRRYLAIAVTRSEPVSPTLRARKMKIASPRAEPPSSVIAAESQPAPRLYMPAAAPLPKPITTRSPQQTQLVTEISSPISTPAPLPAASLEIPTLVKPREDVHTGIFGGSDESGGGNSASAGRGHGGFVNAKFSDGQPNGAMGGKGRTVVSGAFGDSRVSASTQKPKQESAKPLNTPAKILVKPTAVYTPEARSKNIEGDVVLKVIFTAAGGVQIVGVVRGLGFGLDEAAQAAAKQIQFQPATENGKPVDFPAVVRIAFQLAE
jgi:TonB family protein